MTDHDTELAREIAEDLFAPKYLENALGKHTLDAFKSCFIRTVEQALARVRQEENEEACRIVCINCHHGYGFSEEMPQCHRIPYRDSYSLEPCSATAIRNRLKEKP